MIYTILIRKYRRYLPVKENFIVSLNEGNTPLINGHRLREHLKLPARLYFKFEGQNPTGSFKDRGMTYAISKACEAGSKAVICASTGNTSASAAAYAARAGIRCFVVVPQGKIALGKLSQALHYGAKVIQIVGNFDQALHLVRDIGQKYPVTIVNSINPHRIQGQITAAFEVVEQLAVAPDFHFLPVGNAGNITAYWRGYKTYFNERKIKTLPKMMGFQASGAAPIVLGKVVQNPETVASAIRIGNPASWQGALAARDESQGVIDKVTDKEILTAYIFLAKYEGVFCEPAGAAGLAGLIKLSKKMTFNKNQNIVCTLTGHGLKDLDTALKMAEKPISCSANIKEIVKRMGF